MVRIYVLLLLAAFVLAGGGCSTPSGSREYIPGQGWVPVEGSSAYGKPN
jgi:hypothetical protein